MTANQEKEFNELIIEQKRQEVELLKARVRETNAYAEKLEAEAARRNNP